MVATGAGAVVAVDFGAVVGVLVLAGLVAVLDVESEVLVVLDESVVSAVPVALVVELSPAAVPLVVPY